MLNIEKDVTLSIVSKRNNKKNPIEWTTFIKPKPFTNILLREEVVKDEIHLTKSKLGYSVTKTQVIEEITRRCKPDYVERAKTFLQLNEK